MARSLPGWLLALGILASLAAIPRARAREPTTLTDGEAKARWRQANVNYGAGRYRQAITGYLAAYQRLRVPRLLFNLAQAYRLTGDARSAIDYYRRFLASAQGRGTEEARAHLARLTAESGAQEAGPPASRAPPLAPRSGDAAVVEADRARGDGSSGRGRRLVGMATAALGVALAGVGTYYGFEAKKRADQIEERCPCQWSEIESIDAEGRHDDRNAKILWITGGALAVTGGILYALGVRAAHGSEAGAALVPTRNGMALTWSASFR